MIIIVHVVAGFSNRAIASFFRSTVKWNIERNKAIMKNETPISNFSIQVITFLLILLWVPVTIDKFLDLGKFHSTLLNQPFPNWWADILYGLLPLLELLVVIFLVWPKRKLQHLGMLLSTVLLMVFTSYIALGLLDVFEQRPCGCGSVITGMSWEQHFWFNLFFLLLSFTGVLLHRYIQQSDGPRLAKAEGLSAKRRIKSII